MKSFMALALTAGVTADSTMRRPDQLRGGSRSLGWSVDVDARVGIRGGGWDLRHGRLSSGLSPSHSFFMVAALFLGAILWLGGFHLLPQQAEDQGATSELGWRQTSVSYGGSEEVALRERFPHVVAAAGCGKSLANWSSVLPRAGGMARVPWRAGVPLLRVQLSDMQCLTAVSRAAGRAWFRNESSDAVRKLLPRLY